MSGTVVTNAIRTQAVLAACTAAFDQAYVAYARGDSALRLFWLSIQSACSAELQDCVAADKAGVP